MINYDLKKVRAIVFDVDGVLSASTVQMDRDGEPMRTMNIKDGYAIQLAEKLGLRIAIMTGGRNKEIQRRYEYLGVEDVFLNCSVKIRVWNDFVEKYQLEDDEVIYVGDDIPDYEVMKRAAALVAPRTPRPILKRFQIMLAMLSEAMAWHVILLSKFCELRENG